MAVKRFRAPTEEYDDQRFHRYDTRRTQEKIYEALSNPNYILPFTVLSIVALLILPALTMYLFLATYFLFLIVKSNKQTLPMRLPIETKLPDYNVREMGGVKSYTKAEGKILFGYCSITGQQVWAGINDMLRHILLLGVTGSGKTEALLGITANVLSMGGGLVYSDAKGTVKLAWQVYAIATLLGREDDVLIQNFITGGLSPTKRSKLKQTSNTAMPFGVGAADSIMQTLISLLPEGGGGNDVFRDRAIAVMGALLSAKVDLRDLYGIPVDPESVREVLDLGQFVKILNGEYGQLLKSSKKAIEQYLKKLPGWVEGVDVSDQSSTVQDQFGFAQMYWSRPLSQIVDTYSHIYADTHGDIDYADVILNRRILVVMLPSMEKALDELAQLGKLTLAALKSVMALGLGFELQGTKAEVIDSLMSAESVPFKFICDEYGYMAVKGFPVAAAQARGLGISTTFAGQGIVGFKVLNPGLEGDTETGQILDNTRIKIAMALEDHDHSASLFIKLAGKINIKRENSWDMNSLGNARASRTATVESVDRIHINDLRNQVEGEAHMLWFDKVIRFRFFHADPQLAKKEAVSLNIGVAIRLERPEDIIGVVKAKTKNKKTTAKGGAKNKVTSEKKSQKKQVNKTKSGLDKQMEQAKKDLAHEKENSKRRQVENFIEIPDEAENYVEIPDEEIIEEPIAKPLFMTLLNENEKTEAPETLSPLPERIIKEPLPKVDKEALKSAITESKIEAISECSGLDTGLSETLTNEMKPVYPSSELEDVNVERTKKQDLILLERLDDLNNMFNV